MNHLIYVKRIHPLFVRPCGYDIYIYIYIYIDRYREREREIHIQDLLDARGDLGHLGQVAAGHLGEQRLVRTAANLLKVAKWGWINGVQAKCRKSLVNQEQCSF